MQQNSASVFSVVVPLYNKASHVKRALESVRKQSLQPAEIIVIDDGSTDGGLEIVQSLNLANLKVLRRDEPGPGGYAARNLGMKASSSEWIAFLDADDEWLPPHLEGLANAALKLEGRNVSCISSAFEAQGASSTTPCPFFRKNDHGSLSVLTRQQFLATWLELGECPIWTSAIACRRDAADAVGGFPAGRCKRGGDKDLWFRLSGAGDIAILAEITAVYHTSSTNMVTRRPMQNLRHCMCETLEAASVGASSKERRQLDELFNLEVMKYALSAAKSQPLDAATWKGYRAKVNPIGYVTLQLLSNRAVSTVARVALSTAKMLGLRRSGAISWD